MQVILGIDIGGSTTKLVGYTAEGMRIGMVQVKASDPLTSMYGGLGTFISQHQLALADVQKIVLTGVGSALVEGDIYGIPTSHVDEFIAIGLGGLALSGLPRGIIVSMGTGTAFVRADGRNIRHLGGSGVGGGTLVGLCRRLVGAHYFETIPGRAEDGDLSRVDLTIADISKGEISALPPDTTASNFGKVNDDATPADLTLGVVNMVFQVIGVMAMFAGQNDTVKDVVLTGSLTDMPQARKVAQDFERLYGIHYTIPPDAIYATATGAALSYLHSMGECAEEQPTQSI